MVTIFTAVSIGVGGVVLGLLISGFIFVRIWRWMVSHAADIACVKIEAHKAEIARQRAEINTLTNQMRN